MALTDKNIVITPNIGASSDPKIVFSGADASTTAQNITMQMYPTNSGTLSFEGSAGQLFSITNSLSGTIFSVNDVSGIPSIEVLDTGLIKLGQYNGNILLGTATDNSTDKLQVNGSIIGTILKSSVSSGTAPLTVSSSTIVSNLNADYLDGVHGSSYLRSDISATNSVDLRAPIFYDSNDTGYYVNPNGTSHIYNLTVGTWSNNQSYPGVLITGSTDYNYNFLNGSWSGSVTAGLLANCADQWEIAIHDSGTRVVSPLFFNGSDGYNYFEMGRDIGWGTTPVYATNSFRAPIFYDSNDTGYYLDPNSLSLIGAIRLQRDWGSGVGGLPEQLQIRGGYPSFTLRSSTSNSVWLHHMDGSGSIQHYYSGNGIDAVDWSSRHYMSPSGTFSSIADHRAPIFYDSNDTGYYLDPNSTTTSLQIAGAIEIGNNLARPLARWDASGTTTGMVVFKLPGNTGNYGMVHMVFDIYEYSGNNVATVIIGGHNWGGSVWYNYGAQVVGYTDKQVRLGIKDGQYCVVFGTSGSSWSYGQVVLRKIQNGQYYDNSMDLGGTYTTSQTTTESFTWVSSDLRTLGSAGTVYSTSDMRAPIFYDSNNTGYYADPAGTSNFAGLTVANTITGSVSGSASKWNGSSQTVSTSAPSGGSDSDIWFQYA